MTTTRTRLEDKKVISTLNSSNKDFPEKVVRGIVKHVNEDHRQEMLEFVNNLADLMTQQ